MKCCGAAESPPLTNHISNGILTFPTKTCHKNHNVICLAYHVALLSTKGRLSNELFYSNTLWHDSSPKSCRGTVSH